METRRSILIIFENFNICFYSVMYLSLLVLWKQMMSISNVQLFIEYFTKCKS